MAKIYPHTNFVAPREQLKQALESPERGRIIFVVGPSGVGKTTVRRSILRNICGDPRRWGEGKIPVIETFALLPNKAYFSPLGLAQTLVRELSIPNVRWLRDEDDLQNPTYLDVQAAIERCQQELRGAPVPKGSEPFLWDQFKRIAPVREVWLAVIDQAHALCTNHRNKDPADHILNLTSIIESVGMNLLLSGVHGVAELWAERPEVRRRSTVIWMPPYNYDRRQDRDPFLTLLRTMSQEYKFSKPNLMFDMAAELMAASAGIIGVLRKIFVDAKKHADLAGSEVIRKGDITASYYGEKDFKKMWADVKFFQEVMQSADTADKAAEVANAWGLIGTSKAAKSAEFDDGATKEAA